MYRQRPDIVTREIIGETLLVPVRGEIANMQRIFSLSEVGAHIWKNLDGEHSEEAIADSVSQCFDIDQASATADCRQFIGELREANLLEEA